MFKLKYLYDFHPVSTMNPTTGKLEVKLSSVSIHNKTETKILIVNKL